jgi:nitric-oxide synthase
MTFSSPHVTSPLMSQAHAFIMDMAADNRYAMNEKAIETRLQAISEEIERTGTYTHTSEELQFGVQWAWRASNRCIGRHMWRSLKVQDCRNTQDHAGVVRALGQHLDMAWQDGAIQSVITVFAPRTPGRPNQADAVRIANHQLLRYAGFKQEDGSILGDPHSVEFTQRMLDKGWEPKSQTAYTPLPWSVWIHDEECAPVDHFAAHPEQFPEVDITHPDYPGIDAMGLRWYAIPLISEMALVIGGITYPCAPFNGWYMGTEIAARNFCDPERYDLLETIGTAMGLDTSSQRTLWKDHALIAINQAVLHSFDRAGFRIGDHHELGAQFERFCKIEDKAGRKLKGDWSWLTPPISGSLSPQFHRDFDNNVEAHTNFFYQAGPAADVAARHEVSEMGSSQRPSDPFHLENQHETPRCPFGFDRIGKVLPFKRPSFLKGKASGH